MNERAAQMVLLVRAFEEADRNGVLLPREQRMAATRRAVIVTTREGGEGEFSRDVLVPSEETILRRARLLFNALNRRVASIERVLELSRLRSLMGPVIVLLALVVGVSTQVLGPERHVNLLAFPLVGLLAWNLAIYAGLIAMCFVGRRRGRHTRDDVPRPPGGNGTDMRERLVTGLSDAVVRFALWRSRWGWQRHARTSESEARVTSRAFIRYSALWHRLTRDLLESRVRRRMHLAAAALVAGVVLGMYLRGFAFEYRVTWESTLLDAPAVQRILGLLLAPAAALFGASVPDVTPLQAPQDGPAAIWIHLYALTALLYVGIPRLALALVELIRGVRMKARLDLDLEDGYFRRLLADWQGSTKQVAIVPYSFRPSAQTLDVLKTLLHDFFGTRATIHVQPVIEYGEAPPGDIAPLFERHRAGSGAESDPHHAHAEDHYVVALFSLAQTPEAEVHGQLLQSLKDGAEEIHGHVLVLVDVSTYKSGGVERGEERLRAWTKVARQVGLTVVDLDPARTMMDYFVADDRMAAFRAAMWPHEKVAEAG